MKLSKRRYKLPGLNEAGIKRHPMRKAFLAEQRPHVKQPMPEKKN